jgi:shikimate 5-dehydrogenase
MDALKWSIGLAKKLTIPLTVLYTYRLYKQDGEIFGIKKKLEEEASKNFEAIEKELLAGTGITYDFKTEVGFVDDRIEDHARKNKVSFLVMGKSMSIRNKDFDALVDQLKIPLVLVPETLK